MILLDLNQSEVTLQVLAVGADGSEKLDVSSAEVRVYYMSGGSETVVLATQALAQVGGSNTWRYNWSPVSLPVREYVAEYTLTDVLGLVSVVAEDLVVRDIARQTTLSTVQSTLTLVQTDVEIIRKVETGRWKIVANQMIFYDDDETTPILTFDLKDDAGLPSMTTVFERDPV
jgi:hypothetical protein